ncbi:NUDIX domain-containing protein [Nocardia sp. 2]|uniref:NUDIX domain-containing protein n=1 Tax=Nocardia acididurans TaxID=2802282 RepID=A0ABS1MF66_9NOCA|nr:NUDIX domain-containing protein [Nocardia acididurans]MBL1079287.1 NUDIX domain-containing protein [Nocardia acididurans]
MAAYAACVREAAGATEILLTRWIAPDGGKQWTLPGGGMHHGEDPIATAVREVGEETGYTIELIGLIGIDSINRRYPRPRGESTDFHGIRIIYEDQITAGELRNETNGSTDLAAWHPLDAVIDLNRVELVNIGIELWRTRPALGRASR